jgi:hypothetical protein
MNSQWVRSGNVFQQQEISQQQKLLDPGVYRVDMNDFTKELYLTLTDDIFQMPVKLYGSDRAFAERCVRTYNATKGNMGLLLSGVKGTGKTVTAQLISNIMRQPVLVVTTKYDSLPKFINGVQQDIIVFIDEYEKIYNNYDHSVLTVMDGVLSTAYRRMFLFTTNDPWVNQNMLQRPSRIRYVKTFGDLDRATIEEVVDDLLIHKELREDTVEYLTTLETITIDITKALIDEVNIHKESPKEFKSFFNTKQVDNRVRIYGVAQNGDAVVETVKFPAATINPVHIGTSEIGQDLKINGRDVGEIKQVLGDLITYEDYEGNAVSIRVEPIRYTHKAFAYA